MKLSQRLQNEKSYVESLLADSTICQLCGATLATYAERCKADLSDPCPGFMAIENAKGAFAEENPIRIKNENS